ncbi:MAG: ferrous iron transporter B [Deltaproteobacteria bacterium]|nr:ferrous iron transporter B [Deltaproteobacteria bacterium]
MTTKNSFIKKIAVVGRPNTGKSLVFSCLTRKYSMSGNLPFTTLALKRVMCRMNDEAYEIVDTPALNSLYIQSEEEIIVRDLLLSEKPDVIIQCVDANRIKQSLVLTIDLIELGIPMVMSLNAVDETARKGVWIDSERLSHILGIPVVEMVAINGHGVNELKNAVVRARKGRSTIRYGDVIENSISSIVDKMPREMLFRKKIAMLLLQHDSFLTPYLITNCGQKNTDHLIQHTQLQRQNYAGNINLQINSRRDKWIDETVDEVVKKQRILLGGFSRKASRISRHPVFGVPVLLGILYALFFTVVHVANKLALLLNDLCWLPVQNIISKNVTSVFWNDFLIGHYGILTLGLSNAILTVLPILGIFFILFNVLEDSGYIPNLCVLLRRLSSKIGVTGNALLPITLAFGCKTMATLTTMSLRSRKEKFIAVYLIAFGIPCAAQMALNMSILGNMGFTAIAITFSILGLLWITIGMILNLILKNDEKVDFIQELPPMRLPHIKAILKKTFYKLRLFLEEALPIFIGAALLMFTIDRIGLLDMLKNALRPVITGYLGFPLQMVDVLVLLMAKHEAAAGLLIKMVARGELNYVQCIVAVTLTMMFVPCLANIMAMIKEQGVKKALVMILSINCTAIAVAGGLNWFLVHVAGL